VVAVVVEFITEVVAVVEFITEVFSGGGGGY
jgi:hypothetical protein